MPAYESNYSLSSLRSLPQAEAERLAIEAAAKAEAERLANTYPVMGSLALAGPTVITASGSVVSAATQLAVRASIGSAIGGLAALASSVAAGLFVGVSALLYSSRLGNGELPQRYALQTPLSDLASNRQDDLHAIAARGGSAELPYRISSRTDAEGHSEILVIPTDGQAIPADVRVLAATYDAQRKLYSATTADTPPRTLTWTPIVNPSDPSTTLPTEQPEPPVYDGASITPMDGRIDAFPEAADASFDDYIIVFPVDSGMLPIYTMFRDRREEPGTVTGQGTTIESAWAPAASQGEGATIPSQIADKLRGQSFSNWRGFRSSLWKAVASEQSLATQFNAGNLAKMKLGQAPFVPRSERVGARSVYELHHRKPISLGGDVYDVDNITLTPQDCTLKSTGESNNENPIIRLHGNRVSGVCQKNLLCKLPLRSRANRSGT
ncbi:S-type pyocin domain-containing protein [Pseudomonas entomophila]|uniref:S-type pyocin domain-containing protein n=1 Tax=Pseudomonas entomophila TaxID=312306 RepID=UPI0023D804F3|nr:S-type pyocin domain-containing protein [Pseudomonas entomophila]MDF0732709.1 S-type pyocin domain-containing protein [Pseudomonas entomophila]